MTIRSTARIMLHIIFPLVLLVVTIVVVIILFSKPSSSDCKFLYKPSIYLQQGADPTFTLFPVLYKVVNNAGRYFIVKVYFKTKDCWYSVMLWNWWCGIGERTWCYWKNWNHWPMLHPCSITIPLENVWTRGFLYVWVGYRNRTLVKGVK